MGRSVRAPGAGAAARSTAIRLAAALAAAATLTSLVLAWRPAAEAGPPIDDRPGPGAVEDLVARCLHFANRVPGKPKLTIAVVDREGNSLGVFHAPGSKGSAARALAKAATATYFSSDEGTFSTRTAAFIIQDHFPPGVRYAPGGPLYGVEFSSLGASDVNPIFFRSDLSPAALRGLLFGRTRNGDPTTGPADDLAGVKMLADMRVRGDLGGVAIYRGNRRIGGLGVDDGNPRSDITIPERILFPKNNGKGPNPRRNYRLTFRNQERGRSMERVVMAAARDRLISKDFRANKITVDGFTLPFRAPVGLSERRVEPLSPLSSGTWDADFPLTDGSPIASRFSPATFDPPPGNPQGESYTGEVPDAFPVRDGTDGGLTAADVERILWQGAQRANITRGAIRRPIGRAMQCWVSVVDSNGEVLGVFRFREDATLFSYDVSVQKARTALLFSDEKAAWSCRAVGQVSQMFYPAGQQDAQGGPLYQLQDGISVGLLTGALVEPGGSTTDPILATGITIFPGGVPLYKGGRLVGAVGVSGDGVDQDDIVADFASRGFGAPQSIRCDAISGNALKASLGRTLDRLASLVRADPGGVTEDPLATLPEVVDSIGLNFFHARLNRARTRLRHAVLNVSPPYVKHPRHPGPVTIR